MIKALPASCVEGVVTIDGVAVEGVIILSEGLGSSSGVAYIDADEIYYVAKTSPDLDTTLEKLIAALEKIATALSSLDNAGFLISADAGVSSPPLATADISAINVAKSQLEALKEVLK